jgi:uncharacterized protein
MSKSPIVSRILSKNIALALKHFPFVSITGPRQSGKTTIGHLIANDYKYINLEIAKFKNFAKNDPEIFLKKYDYKIILDEVQTVPELFPYLMVHTDNQNKNGAYILSGSQNILLMESITQSLAGRVAIFSLLPFAYSELDAYLLEKNKTWHAICFRGLYPRLFNEKKLSPSIFYQSYIKTFVKKDISKLANIHNSNTFTKFIALLAVRAGTVLNYSSLANDLNIDSKTVQKWISFLEISYIIYLLPSYHNNFDKRILKANKVYFTDPGLLCFLLRIRSEQSLLDSNFSGQIFENFIIIEMLKKYYNKGEEPNFYYWQDSNQNEVDLLIETDKVLELYEIKSSSTPKTEFTKNLKKFMALTKLHNINTKAFLVYTGSESYKQANINITSWSTLFK